MNNSDTNITIDFEPISRRIRNSQNKSFYEILVDANIQIQSLCGGMGSCGKCRILINKGAEYLNDHTSAEEKLLSREEITKDWRLACQCKINPHIDRKNLPNASPHVRIFLPEELLVEDFKILTSGLEKGVNLNPAMKKFFLSVAKPTLDHPLSDIERISASLNKLNLGIKKLDFNFQSILEIPQILRQNDHEITLTIFNNSKVIKCESGNTSNDNYGIAFDIGTTTLVGYLINLNNGKTYAISSKLNPQTAYGEDLITRMTFIKNNPNGLNSLHSLVLDALNDIITRVCKEANVKQLDINEAVIVGNSVMHHLFIGLNPEYIGLSPYVPVVQKDLNLNPTDIGLNISSKGNIYTLPLIAGFVGADTMGVIISSEVDKEDELTLAIDIGTNGEIILGNSAFIATGSCAAGSALEGAHIKHGMRAAGGSIDSVKINPKDFKVKYTTIKNKKPIGICGSGLIDAVAEMLKCQILTRSGSFNKQFHDHERILRKDNTAEFILAFEDETSLGKPITLTQSDIRQIQMAKGAFYSGSKIILNEISRNADNPSIEIGQVFLAGAFGNYIDKFNAKFIGMIPDVPDERIFQIGNAAGIGAQYCLLNKDLRKRTIELLKSIKYVEIAIKENFQRIFAESMYFPNMKLSEFPSLKIYESIPKK